jgi:carbon monoxide dehydrogenase subunit G
VGSRLIESVAKKLSGVFFDNFETAIAPPLGQVRIA